MAGQASPERQVGSGVLNSAVITREIEDLKSKLRVMERKRREDLDKFSADAKEISRVKNVAKRLELKLAPMHQEIVQLRAKLQELEAENTKLVDEHAKNEEFLELSTLDKEMAEEKCENLLLELNELKERWDEMELECETLREENSLYEGLKEEQDEVANQNALIENVRLAKKNEQLQAALLRFRDLMQEKEDTYQEKLKSLESTASDAQTASNSFEQVSRKLSEADSVIKDLRMQLDNALGAEDMIESLTEKNLELQEKIEELQATIDELETLKVLNDELESNHLLTEKQLLADVDELEEMNNAIQDKLVQSGERNAYLESAVAKFKEVVAILESDLSELRTSNQNINADSAAMAQHTKSLMELNLKLNSTALEANSKAMDLQLGKFKAQQALDQLAIVKHYLPEGYSADERAIEALLRLDRIAFKSEIIETFLSERTKTMEAHSFSVVDHTKIFTSLVDVRRYSTVLAYHVRTSSIEGFQQYASYYAQTEQVETVLTSIIDVLKEDTFQEKAFLKDLDSILHKLWVLYNDCSKAQSEQPRHVLAVNDLSSIQISSRLVTDIYNDLVEAMEELSLDPNSESVIISIKSHLGAFSRIKVLSSRISNELESLYDDSKLLLDDLYDALSKLNADAKLFTKYLLSVLQRLRSTVSETRPQSSADAIELFKKQFANVYEPETQPTTNINLLISEKMESIVNSMKDYTFTNSTLKSFTKPLTPWEQKEKDLNDIKLSHSEKDKEITELKLEIQRLATNVRAREKTIEELQVKLGLLNSKMERSKEQVSKITEVKTALAASIAEQKKLQDTVKELRKSLVDQDKTITKYKKGNLKADSSFLEADFQENFDKVVVASMRHEISSLKSLVDQLCRSKKTNEDYSWLEPKANKSQFFSQQDLLFRSKAHSAFTDIRKGVLEASVIKIQRPMPGRHQNRSAVRIQTFRQRDLAAKIDLIVSSLVNAS